MYTSQEYLQAAIESGMIDLTTIRKQIEMAERNKYLEGHKIYSDKNGKFYAKLGDKMVKRTTKEAIEEEIIKHEKDGADNPSVKEVFNRFMDQKLRYKDISESTYDRYKKDYNRYIKGKPIEDMKFRSLTEEYLEDFIRCAIADNDLTAKAFSNLKTIIRGMLLYAKGKFTQISAESFFGDMQFSKNTFARKVINKEKEVYLEDEIPMAMEYLDKRGGINHLGILLAFQTGVRVGELAAIEREDISVEDGAMFIHIHRTETKYKKDGVYITKVKEYPKSSAGDRYVFCTEQAAEIVNRIIAKNPNGRYLFEENGKRLHEYVFANTINWMCKSLNIPVRSMHKIRKTYGTTLIDGGVDESIIVEQMGHSDIHCTKQYYYFSNKNREKKCEQIERAMKK